MNDVTIYTIAEELNMTPSMVSRAFNPKAKINNEKRKLVLETAEKYNFSPNKFASRLSMGTIRIGIIINSRFKVNTDKMIMGINTAYEVLKDYKLKYDISVLNPNENKLGDYEKILRKYANYDGVILTGLSSDKYTNAINALYQKNSNVVQVQAINEDTQYLFASKHNEKTASEIAAEFLYNCLKKSERKNIVLFTGDKDSLLHSGAEKAFKNACSKFGLNLLDSVDMKDDNSTLKALVPKVFKKHKNMIDGIYITSGVSSALCEYIEKHKTDVIFVGFDTHKDIKYYMQKNIISATIDQDVVNQMRSAFELLVKHIINKETCPKTIYTDVQLVLKSNMHQFE